MVLKIKKEFRFTPADHKHIREELKKQNTTLKGMAEYMGWSYSYIFKVLNGQADGTELYKELFTRKIFCELERVDND